MSATVKRCNLSWDKPKKGETIEVRLKPTNVITTLEIEQCGERLIIRHLSGHIITMDTTSVSVYRSPEQVIPSLTMKLPVTYGKDQE
jgi:hypothetical protein